MTTGRLPVLGPIRVAASSDPGAVAGSIAARIRDCGSATVTAMGRDAVFVAVKALASAVHFCKDDGEPIVVTPAMVDTETEVGLRTVMAFDIVLARVLGAA
jgi:stage V sporulation protein S